MTEGLIFDIKEFALQDGPGIRTTVFLKGCPLRCIWCHNPEGLSDRPEISLSLRGCTNCGLCRQACEHDDCRQFGRCLHVCPKDLVKRVGEYISPEQLAERLSRYRDIMQRTGGGVTFSGGEPMRQWRFVCDTISALGDLHTIVETSGYADTNIFASVAESCSEIYLDIKHMDDAKHRQLTGVSNILIQKNLSWLISSGKPFTIRVPVIPGCNDETENLSAIAKRLRGAEGLRRVEFLPYNTLAGAKYSNVGRQFEYHAPSKKQVLVVPESDYRENGVPFLVLNGADQKQKVEETQ